MRNVWRRFLISSALGVVLLFFSAPAAWADGCVLDNIDPVCAYAGAVFLTNQQQPTGTGVIDSFLRVQMKGTEQGFNTDARQSTTLPSGPSAGVCDTVDCNSKTDLASYTRDIQLSEVGIVTYQGQQYYDFLLDVNEQAALPKNWITLDQLELYASPPAPPPGPDGGTVSSSDITHNTGAMNTATGGSLVLTGVGSLSKVYDLDTGLGGINQDNWINIDYNLSGSGSGMNDMAFLVPISAFAGYSPDTYVYLYSEFGCVGSASSGTAYCGPNGNPDKYKSGAGFEEWWTLNQNGGGGGGGGIGAVPEPGTFALIGTGLAFVARRRRQGRAAKVE